MHHPAQLALRKTPVRRLPNTAAILGTAFALLLGLAIAPASLASDFTVTGTVKWDGPPVRKRAIRMSADPKCEELNAGKRVMSEDQMVGEGGIIENVFVYLKTAPAGTPTPKSDKPATLTQHGCMYTPRLQGIYPEQELEVVNDDPTLHNVRCLARANRPFNLGQPAKGKRTKFFTTAEKAIKFKCDVHPWMSAYIFVMDHPFFSVTDSSGQFSLAGLPAGKHTLVAWHEKFGETEIVVDVSADQTADIVLKPKD